MSSRANSFHFICSAERSEAAFVAPAAPVPRRVEGGRQAQKTQKASSLEAYMRSLSLDGIASALSNQLGLDAVVDCVGDRPDLRSALRDCEVSRAFELLPTSYLAILTHTTPFHTFATSC